MIQFFDDKNIDKMWVISDLHFGHRNILKYSPCRAAFADNDIDLHDQRLIENINDCVGDSGILLCLGDVAMQKKYAERYSPLILTKEKYLIRGNHDNCSESSFKDMGWFILPMLEIYSVLFSHYPVHPCEMRSMKANTAGGKYIANVHGHVHCFNIDDPRYYNVSLEQTEMKPVKMTDLLERIVRDYNKRLNTSNKQLSLF